MDSVRDRKPRRLYTGKMHWDEAMEAIRRVKAGQSIKRVARRYRREPSFIEGMLAYYESELPNFASPYMHRMPCSRARAAEAEARQWRYLWPRLLNMPRYWLWLNRVNVGGFI